MKSMTFRSAAGAALTVALSAVALPASAASAAQTGVVDGATATSFGQLADAVLTERTAALLDGQQVRSAAAPVTKKARLSAGLTRNEKSALSTLRTRKARLAAMGEAYTKADTKVTVGKTRVMGGRATVQATETICMT